METESAKSVHRDDDDDDDEDDDDDARDPIGSPPDVRR